MRTYPEFVKFISDNADVNRDLNRAIDSLGDRTTIPDETLRRRIKVFANALGFSVTCDEICFERGELKVQS